MSARLYKFFGGLRWKTNILLTGLCCPGVVVSVFLILNSVLLMLHSSAAVPFTSILEILSMWLLVSLPLCAIGSFFGFRQQVSATAYCFFVAAWRSNRGPLFNWSKFTSIGACLRLSAVSYETMSRIAAVSCSTSRLPVHCCCFHVRLNHFELLTSWRLSCMRSETA